MSAFDLLDPLVQHHIVNSVGWRELRPLQEASIKPILGGDHCLLLAPTAGGKTEAAMFPVFSRMVGGRWSGLTVLYICPLKALLNNLHQRISHYAGVLGRRCEVWHGDVSASRKDRVRVDPPDVLLTTPESLEGMLVSVNPAGREMLATLRVVVVDEIHAFAGDDRGWHLLCVLERVGQIAGRDLQRIGLSATVGNPEQLLSWFAGHCAGAAQVISPTVNGKTAPDVTLDYVGSLENAALVISRLHRGEKRLVFCDSRSRVEELARHLRGYGVETFLSHSSLSIDERRQAERAFAESRNCVIVATSTLELGIDVGDLDRVIQIDAPNSVASFLQRLGRTGRREGSSRNCLFLATSEKAVLKAAGLLELWASGFVEPIEPPPQPLHIFSQQLMALALQLGGIGTGQWKEWIGRLPAFAAPGFTEAGEIIEHLKAQGILFEDSGLLGFGVEGEARFDRRHFLEILSVFASPSMLTAFHGARELGQVEAGCLARAPDGGAVVIALGGHSWTVRQIDWRSRRLQVEPTTDAGRGAWIGGGLGTSHHIAGAIKQVLVSDTSAPTLSSRARSALEQIRAQFAHVQKDGHTLLVSPATNRATWFTFAGGVINDLLGAHFAAVSGVSAHADDLGLTFSAAGEIAHLEKSIAALSVDEIETHASFDDEAVEALKFSECLPPRLRQAVLKKRLLKPDVLERLLAFPTRTVYEGRNGK